MDSEEGEMTEASCVSALLLLGSRDQVRKTCPSGNLAMYGWEGRTKKWRNWRGGTGKKWNQNGANQNGANQNSAKAPDSATNNGNVKKSTSACKNPSGTATSSAANKKEGVEKQSSTTSTFDTPTFSSARKSRSETIERTDKGKNSHRKSRRSGSLPPDLCHYATYFKEVYSSFEKRHLLRDLIDEQRQPRLMRRSGVDADREDEEAVKLKIPLCSANTLSYNNMPSWRLLVDADTFSYVERPHPEECQQAQMRRRQVLNNQLPNSVSGQRAPLTMVGELKQVFDPCSHIDRLLYQFAVEGRRFQPTQYRNLLLSQLRRQDRMNSMRKSHSIYMSMLEPESWIYDPDKRLIQPMSINVSLQQNQEIHINQLANSNNHHKCCCSFANTGKQQKGHHRQRSTRSQICNNPNCTSKLKDISERPSPKKASSAKKSGSKSKVKQSRSKSAAAKQGQQAARSNTSMGISRGGQKTMSRCKQDNPTSKTGTLNNPSAAGNQVHGIPSGNSHGIPMSGPAPSQKFATHTISACAVPFKQHMELTESCMRASPCHSPMFKLQQTASLHQQKNKQLSGLAGKLKSITFSSQSVNNSGRGRDRKPGTTYSFPPIKECVEPVRGSPGYLGSPYLQQRGNSSSSRGTPRKSPTYYLPTLNYGNFVNISQTSLAEQRNLSRDQEALKLPPICKNIINTYNRNHSAAGKRTK